MNTPGSPRTAPRLGPDADRGRQPRDRPLRRWSPPRLEVLPGLSELTLDSTFGGSIGGSGNTGGGTVF